MSATTFLVSDMTCGHCEKTLRGALADVLPDASVSIDLATHKLTVTGDAATAEAAIRDAGYSPERVG
ncbi:MULTISPECIES: heavy-metal-associated domain-containing protein [Rhizobium/Agrobacterium group]|uniref:Copper chaperone n=2 Tax=Rhizobium/Agrobacterium group TaxID=227290 RepID=A0A546Y7Z8_AGRTU|nr:MULTISPECIES: heavy-metal-associated domain-containing protein [Rhizobium/Agrobacterium group]AQS62316.1 copper chaperone [Rhizobium rhizogenes]MBO0128321.1 heavy-metal-associated domain-containing protein [Agrobacterium sp. OT33]MCZ7442381.1 heavy-metal-associated domain-containing protein [Rhizobium rhizogenes]MCZ7479136.1 heavy-metal-associated domain-containing protein [Rhizobium rhizogenes]NSX90000.1 heavy-metal-associated domain-containing protein [Agrobacterium tumefaciens]